MITVKLPLILSTKGHFEHPEIVLNDICDVSEILLNDFKLKSDDFYLTKCSENIFQVKLRLLGGKGGFGSQLRAQGNKMSSKKRAGNYESCRSLNGQRLRVQKHTKLIEEYLAKEPERLSKREQEIREKMQKYLEAPDKKIMFSDPDYLKLCRKLIDNTEDAVRSGLRAQQTQESETESDDETESESGPEDELDFDNEVDESIESETKEEPCDSKQDSESDEDEKEPIRISNITNLNANSNNTNKSMYKNNYLDKYLSMK